MSIPYRLGAVLGVLLCIVPVVRGLQSQPAARAVAWSDLPAPIQQLIESRGVGADTFAAYVEGVRARTAERLHEGDFEHLVYYALQSTRISSRPVIEPALSAKGFVEGLPQEERTRFLAAANPTWLPDPARVPADARGRLFALRDAVARREASDSIRLTHFRDVLRVMGALDAERASRQREPRQGGSGQRRARQEQDAQRQQQQQDDALLRAYMRAMRFLYQKEFVAMRGAERDGAGAEAGTGARAAEAVAALYQTRGFSSDTAVEASYGVYVALATAHGLDAGWRAQRVLVVGPGLDLAPRTDLIDAFEPQSYQPFLAADALVALGVADRDRLRVDAVDINPLVVDVLQRAARTPRLRLFILTGIAEDARTRLADDYRSYFTSLGRAVGSEEPWSAGAASPSSAASAPPLTPALESRLRKIVRVAPEMATSTSARVFNVVTDRVAGDAVAFPQYDAIIVTNVFPYLDDKELLLALSNVASQLAPGGFLIHNEPRPLLVSTAGSIGLPISQARSVLIATKSNGRHLYDTIWLHRKDASHSAP